LYFVLRQDLTTFLPGLASWIAGIIEVNTMPEADNFTLLLKTHFKENHFKHTQWMQACRRPLTKMIWLTVFNCGGAKALHRVESVLWIVVYLSQLAMCGRTLSWCRLRPHALCGQAWGSLARVCWACFTCDIFR
jgi:hypothetical protein